MPLPTAEASPIQPLINVGAEQNQGPAEHGRLGTTLLEIMT